MTRPLALLVFAIGCSSAAPAHPPEPARPEPARPEPREPRASTDPSTDAARSIVESDAPLVVLTFVGQPQDVIPLTAAWRTYLTSRGIRVGPERAAIDEFLLDNCQASPSGNGACVAHIGRRLGARWVLWGALSGKTLELQLVRADAVMARHGSFLPSTDTPPIEAAWRQLSELPS